MGWTVLYIAFGVVALWLLGEVLLQYKARLRWRLLAFVGFLGVVVGVVIPSVVVIAVGAIAFAVGQTYVTLSFRRGFSTGWALRRKEGAGASADAPAPRSGRRRKGGRPSAPLPEPPRQSDDTAVFEPLPDPADGPELVPDAPLRPVAEPLPGDAPVDPAGAANSAGPYGDYADAGYGTAATDPNAGGFTSYDTYGGQQPYPAATPAPEGQFDYGQQQYAAYSDPYIGSRPQTYEQYDAFGQYQPYPQQPYGAGTYPADNTYVPQPYDMDTPPGGVWVPQQRDGENPPPPNPQQQPYPQQTPGYDEQQYRY
ncbi:hypothetical protein [Streptomyces sp. ISL-11]|uniref:hypothetical protein n=1 Tax=Streptomyces sp. ISL-11 TaxID=2819174 RepID=UPI001BEBA5EB|nr:hypothetical protein [Streptomyces sp. ISL-11]MBT2384725.1 hypothetical protein [Streptomyces sp. ISL-11]